MAALIVWLFIHVINAKDSTEHSVKIEHLHEIEERETNQTNEDLMETRGLEDVEHFSVESTTHTDGGGTTQGKLYPLSLGTRTIFLTSISTIRVTELSST